METNLQQSEYTDSASQEATNTDAQPYKEAQELKVDVSVDQPGAITLKTPPAPSTDQVWQNGYSLLLSLYQNCLIMLVDSFQLPATTDHPGATIFRSHHG
jgi:hypothetical protein